MLFKEKRYEDAVKDMAKDPAKFSSFLTEFTVDVRNEMEEDDRMAFDFYIMHVFIGAVLSGGDAGIISKLMLKSVSELLSHDDEEDDDEAEHKQD